MATIKSRTIEGISLGSGVDTATFSLPYGSVVDPTRTSGAILAGVAWVTLWYVEGDGAEVAYLLHLVPSGATVPDDPTVACGAIDGRAVNIGPAAGA